LSADDKYSSDADTGQRDFLSRWSQRKVEAKQKPVADPALAETEEDDLSDSTQNSSSQLTSEELDLLSDEQLLDHLNLPDPDTLKQGDDFTAFMKTVVPARIRNRALRKLWLSNPALANVDMLVDYGDDFTDAATVIPGMTTAYQVGKGIVRKIEELVGEDEESEEIESGSDDTEMSSETQSDDDGQAAEASLTETDDTSMQAELAGGADADDVASIGSDQDLEVFEPEQAPSPELEVESEEAMIASVPLRRMSFSFDS